MQGFDLCGMFADLQVMEGKLKALLAEMAADKAAAAAVTESAGASCDNTRLQEAALTKALSGGLHPKQQWCTLTTCTDCKSGVLCNATAGKQSTTHPLKVLAHGMQLNSSLS
jgi:hypothetical protein